MKKAKIIVLAGQSNAVGVGHIEYLSRHFHKERVEKILNGFDNVLINYFSHDKKRGGFVKTTVRCTEKSKETLGPEVGIAEVLSERYPDETFYIVKCAFGGTNLYHDWLPSSCGGEYDKKAHSDENVHDAHYRKAGWCFNELTNILQESINLLKEQDLLPEICAFCWMQGESDADTADHVCGYYGSYKTLLRDFEELFGEYINDCVYIDGGISEIWMFYREINKIKKEFAEKNDNCYYIDTIAEGLVTNKEPEPETDFAHYDSDCTVKLGNLFAEKFIKMKDAQNKNTLQIVFIRHAETQYDNIGDRDPSDGELTSKGEEQCAELGEKLRDLPIDAYITSSLLRSFKTATGVCKAKPDNPLLEICPELVECGCTPGYYGCSEEYLRRYYKNTRMCPKLFGTEEYDFGCEKVEDNNIRAQKVLDYIQERFTFGDRVAVFSHHGMLEYLIPTALGIKTRDFFFALDNISVTVVDICRDGNRVLRCVNK